MDKPFPDVEPRGVLELRTRYKMVPRRWRGVALVGFVVILVVVTLRAWVVH